MTGYEFRHLLLQPFHPYLNRQVRTALKGIITSSGARPFRLLDVGGRQSPYTVGLPAEVTVSDLPRHTDVQSALNLGFNDVTVSHLQRRRSNVRAVVFDDMTRTALPPASFDAVVAVEVLEHVEPDELFLRQVARTLKPGGFFVMTTPNGEAVPNHNPDHKRHYTRAQLEALLRTAFSRVTVRYAVRMDTFHRMGMKRWSFRNPVAAARSMAGNAMTGITSSRGFFRGEADRSAHLLAVATL